MKLVTKDLFRSLCNESEKSVRKRAHYNLHPELSDPVQRLCVSIGPGSYIRPHRHSDTDKWELFLVLSGSAAILTFDETGRITEKVVISSQGPVFAAEIPGNTWHTLAALEPDTFLVEIKKGPYIPLSESDFASWAPTEGAEESFRFEEKFRSSAIGDAIK